MQRDRIRGEPVVEAEGETGSQHQDGTGLVEAQLGIENQNRDGRGEGFGKHMGLAGLLRAEPDKLGPVRIFAEFSLLGSVTAGDDPFPEHDVLRLPIPLRAHLRPEEFFGETAECLGIAPFGKHLRIRLPFVAQRDDAFFGAEFLATHLQDSLEGAVEIHGDVAQLENGREGRLAVDRKGAIGVAILSGQVVLGLEPGRVPFHRKTARLRLEFRLADRFSVGIQNTQAEFIGVGGIGRGTE